MISRKRDFETIITTYNKHKFIPWIFFLRWGCNGVGDDFYSYGFDGQCTYYGGKAKKIAQRVLRFLALIDP